MERAQLLRVIHEQQEERKTQQAVVVPECCICLRATTIPVECRCVCKFCVQVNRQTLIVSLVCQYQSMPQGFLRVVPVRVFAPKGRAVAGLFNQNIWQYPMRFPDVKYPHCNVPSMNLFGAGTMPVSRSFFPASFVVSCPMAHAV